MKNQYTPYHPNNKSISEIEAEIERPGLCIWPRVKDKDLHSDNFNGLCNTTSVMCIEALKAIGVKAYPNYVGIAAQNPVYLEKTFGHYVCVVQVINEVYIYDMPQTEFIKPAVNLKGGFRYVSDYQPRFIKLTVENLMLNYGIPEESATKYYNRILTYEVNQLPFEDYLEITQVILYANENK